MNKCASRTVKLQGFKANLKDLKLRFKFCCCTYFVLINALADVSNIITLNRK